MIFTWNEFESLHLIVLYHCHLRETIGGSYRKYGSQVLSITDDPSLSESDSVLTSASQLLMMTGRSDVPLLQLYVGTTTSPDCVPTSCATFASAKQLTTPSNSLGQETFVRRNRCLRRPKHQSGENLVWPTIKKERLIFWFRPTITLHIR